MREQRIGATDHELYCQNQLEKLMNLFCHPDYNILTFPRRAPIENSFVLGEKILLCENRGRLIVGHLHLLFFMRNVPFIPKASHASQLPKT